MRQSSRNTEDQPLDHRPTRSCFVFRRVASSSELWQWRDWNCVIGWPANSYRAAFLNPRLVDCIALIASEYTIPPGVLTDEEAYVATAGTLEHDNRSVSGRALLPPRRPTARTNCNWRSGQASGLDAVGDKQPTPRRGVVIVGHTQQFDAEAFGPANDRGVTLCSGHFLSADQRLCGFNPVHSAT